MDLRVIYARSKREGAPCTPPLKFGPVVSARSVRSSTSHTMSLMCACLRQEPVFVSTLPHPDIISPVNKPPLAKKKGKTQRRGHGNAFRPGDRNHQPAQPLVCYPIPYGSPHMPPCTRAGALLPSSAPPPDYQDLASAATSLAVAAKALAKSPLQGDAQFMKVEFVDSVLRCSARVPRATRAFTGRVMGTDSARILLR